MKILKLLGVLALAACLVVPTGCDWTNTSKGTAIGGGTGAVLGAAIGAAFGGSKGATIGSAIGASSGATIGAKSTACVTSGGSKCTAIRGGDVAAPIVADDRIPVQNVNKASDKTHDDTIKSKELPFLYKIKGKEGWYAQIFDKAYNSLDLKSMNHGDDGAVAFESMSYQLQDIGAYKWLLSTDYTKVYVKGGDMARKYNSHPNYRVFYYNAEFFPFGAGGDDDYYRGCICYCLYDTNGSLAGVAFFSPLSNIVKYIYNGEGTHDEVINYLVYDDFLNNSNGIRDVATPKVEKYIKWKLHKLPGASYTLKEILTYDRLDDGTGEEFINDRIEYYQRSDLIYRNFVTGTPSAPCGVPFIVQRKSNTSFEVLIVDVDNYNSLLRCEVTFKNDGPFKFKVVINPISRKFYNGRTTIEW